MRSLDDVIREVERLQREVDALKAKASMDMSAWWGYTAFVVAMIALVR